MPIEKTNSARPLSRRAFLGAAMLTGGAALAFGAEARARDWTGKSPVRYPDPDVISLDPRFARYRLGNAAIERLYTGGRWFEGPAWNGVGRYLVWSDIPRDRQLRMTDENGDVGVFREPSGNSNGNTFDFEGRQISCEHENRRVVRYEYDGSLTVLASQWKGKPLNAPNDVVVHPDGSVWFTDPGYGSMSSYEGTRRALELKEAVYRVDTSDAMAMAIVTDEPVKPNGLCFSPDYSKLYVTDSGGSASARIHRWDIVDGKTLRNRQKFCDMTYEGKSGIADGIRADVDGNIWAAAGWAGAGFDGVHVFAPDGALIGVILLPEICANLCFGGSERNRLFMVASQSLYALYVEARGAHIC